MKEFLEERAQRDFAIARNIYDDALHGTNVVKKRDNAISAFEYAERFNSDKPYKYFVDKPSLFAASVYCLACAGEALKRLEKEVPDFSLRYPQFCLPSIKRIRDIAAHRGEFLEKSDELIDATKRIYLESERIYKHALKYGPMPVTDADFLSLPYAPLIRVMFLWRNGLIDLVATEPNNQIQLTGTPNVKKTCKVMNIKESTLPYLVESLLTCDQLAVFHSRLKTPSLFFKVAHPKIYHTTLLESLQKARNHLAHFDTFFEMHEQNSGKIYIVDTAVTKRNNFEQLAEMYSYVLKQLVAVRNARNEYDEIGYIERTVCDYERILLGTAYNDNDKKMLMDQQVEWVTRSAVKPRSEEAFVFAVGELLKSSSVDDAKEVLAFIRFHKNELAKPSELLKKLDGQSNLLKIKVHRFVDSMQRSLGIDNIGRSAA